MNESNRSFYYSEDGYLQCESVCLSKLPDLIPENPETRTKTPLYVYSKKQLLENISGYRKSFQDRPNIIGYSVKVGKFFLQCFKSRILALFAGKSQQRNFKYRSQRRFEHCCGFRFWGQIGFGFGISRKSHILKRKWKTKVGNEFSHWKRLYHERWFSVQRSSTCADCSRSFSKHWSSDPPECWRQHIQCPPLHANW